MSYRNLRETLRPLEKSRILPCDGNYILAYNPSNIFAFTRLVQTCHVTEYSPAKTGEYRKIFPNFQNCARCEKYLEDNKHNSLHLGRKYVQIFVLGYCRFLEAQSLTLSENCFLLGIDDVRGQISQHIFQIAIVYIYYILTYLSMTLLDFVMKLIP